MFIMIRNGNKRGSLPDEDCIVRDLSVIVDLEVFTVRSSVESFVYD